MLEFLERKKNQRLKQEMNSPKMRISSMRLVVYRFEEENEFPSMMDPTTNQMTQFSEIS